MTEVLFLENQSGPLGHGGQGGNFYTFSSKMKNFSSFSLRSKGNKQKNWGTGKRRSHEWGHVE